MRSSTTDFNAHLVLADPQTRRLHQSPEPGLLKINASERAVTFAYQKGSRGSYVRQLMEPYKCVVAKLGMKIWAKKPRRAVVTCRLVSEREKQCCLEALQVIGVRIIDVNPERLCPVEQERARTHVSVDKHMEELAQLAAALSNPRRSSAVVAAITSYSTSDQLARDVATISRELFSTRSRADSARLAHASYRKFP